MTTIGTTKGKPRTCECGCDRSIQITNTGDAAAIAIQVFASTIFADATPIMPGRVL